MYLCDTVEIDGNILVIPAAEQHELQRLAADLERERQQIDLSSYDLGTGDCSTSPEFMSPQVSLVTPDVMWKLACLSNKRLDSLNLSSEGQMYWIFTFYQVQHRAVGVYWACDRRDLRTLIAPENGELTRFTKKCSTKVSHMANNPSQSEASWGNDSQIICF